MTGYGDRIIYVYLSVIFISSYRPTNSAYLLLYSDQILDKNRTTMKFLLQALLKNPPQMCDGEILAVERPMAKRRRSV